MVAFGRCPCSETRSRAKKRERVRKRKKSYESNQLLSLTYIHSFYPTFIHCHSFLSKTALFSKNEKQNTTRTHRTENKLKHRSWNTAISDEVVLWCLVSPLGAGSPMVLSLASMCPFFVSLCRCCSLKAEKKSNNGFLPLNQLFYFC